MSLNCTTSRAGAKADQAEVPAEQLGTDNGYTVPCADSDSEAESDSALTRDGAALYAPSVPLLFQVFDPRRERDQQLNHLTQHLGDAEFV